MVCYLAKIRGELRWNDDLSRQRKTVMNSGDRMVSFTTLLLRQKIPMSTLLSMSSSRIARSTSIDQNQFVIRAETSTWVLSMHRFSLPRTSVEIERWYVRSYSFENLCNRCTTHIETTFSKSRTSLSTNSCFVWYLAQRHVKPEQLCIHICLSIFDSPYLRPCKSWTAASDVQSFCTQPSHVFPSRRWL